MDSGRRLVKKSGQLADIGITKQHVTEEDLAIERGFAELILQYGEDHTLFAEEEHATFEQGQNVWVVDPISGTANIIKGLAHYSVVVAHIHAGKTAFVAVYDPAIDELFVAYAGKGAFLNGKPIHVSDNACGKRAVLLNLSMGWKDLSAARRIWSGLFDSSLLVYRNTNSMAVNYCNVACGRFEGIVTLSKDVFPEIAGSLILREAGGVFTNREGQERLEMTDRVFIGGNADTYSALSKIVRQELGE